jgi:hypothetical protein
MPPTWRKSRLLRLNSSSAEDANSRRREYPAHDGGASAGTRSRCTRHTRNARSGAGGLGPVERRAGQPKYSHYYRPWFYRVPRDWARWHPDCSITSAESTKDTSGCVRKVPGTGMAGSSRCGAGCDAECVPFRRGRGEILNQRPPYLYLCIGCISMAKGLGRLTATAQFAAADLVTTRFRASP